MKRKGVLRFTWASHESGSRCYQGQIGDGGRDQQLEKGLSPPKLAGFARPTLHQAGDTMLCHLPKRAIRGSPEHEYWRARVARTYREREGEIIAVEIETGKSRWKDNISRDLEGEFIGVVVVCTNEKAYTAINREAKARWCSEGRRLMIVRAQEFCQ